MPVWCLRADDCVCVFVWSLDRIAVVGSCSCDWPLVLSRVTLKGKMRDLWLTRLSGCCGVRSLGKQMSQRQSYRISEPSYKYIKVLKYLFLLKVSVHTLTFFPFLLLLVLFICRSSVGSALPRRRCCAYITIGMICIFIGVGLTVSAAFLLFLDNKYLSIDLFMGYFSE